MPVTYIPSAPNQTPQVDPQGLVQLALAVHQSKLAEDQQKKAEAVSRISTLTQNPDLMTMMDPKSIEKDLATAGFKLADADQVAAMTKMIQGGGAPVAPTPPAATPVPSNQLEQLGATMQGSKAGAQSATPPSKEAAAKSPGGGVTPGGIVTPGTGELQQLQGTAMENYTKQVGSLAPMYMGAATQKQQEYLKARKQLELHNLFQEANGGGPGAVRAYGMLMAEAGHNVTDADMRAMLTGSNDPQVAKEAMDFALGNETGAGAATRKADTLKTLLGNSQFMGKLKDPTDAPRVAQSIVDGHGVPSDVMKRPFSLDEIKDINTAQSELVKQGFNPGDARRAAEAQAIGVPYTLSLPPAMHGLTIPQQEAGAKVTTAAGMYMRGEGAIMEGEAAEQRALDEHRKITKSLDEQLKIKLENDLALQKAGVKLPQELLDEDLRKVAEQSGISVERVSHWYNWLYLGSQLDAQGVASKGALEGESPASVDKPTQPTSEAERIRSTHYGPSPDVVRAKSVLREMNQPKVSPDEAKRIRRLRGSMQP
jgi:hypothetical protein